jgi:bleomycin hydrolase
MGRYKNEKKGSLKQSLINHDFLKDLSLKFKKDPVNIITRNTVNSVGSMFSTINAERVNKISHYFTHTLKKKTTKATNQGRSGRCWMFAALNTFRHLLIHGLDLDNFEFSYVYLFFFDKLERANSYLKWFIDHPDEKPGMRTCDYILSDYMCDGGWWNTFSNLITKYGIIPSNCMKETFQSDDTDDMNKIICEQLDGAVNKIMKHRNNIDLEKLRKDTVSNIYDTLVKFLGEPPEKFDWQFNKQDDNGENISIKMKELSPLTFLKVVAPKMDIGKDFVCLAHLPKSNLSLSQLQKDKKYSVKFTDNVEGGKNMTFLNVDIKTMTTSIIRSIKNGLSVWFAADVTKSFNWLHSTLDDQLDDKHRVFNTERDFDKEFHKGDRIFLKNIQSCHAMAITGFNLDENGKPVNWQVENSWGYIDDEVPGLDGFLNMSHTWFEKYVTNIVVHKKFLNKICRNRLRQKAIEIDPLEPYANVLKVGVYNPPYNYKEILCKRKGHG